MVLNKRHLKASYWGNAHNRPPERMVYGLIHSRKKFGIPIEATGLALFLASVPTDGIRGWYAPIVISVNFLFVISTPSQSERS